MYASKFRWTKGYILAIFALFEAPYFGMHALMQNIMIMASSVCSIFTAIDANYTHLDTSIHVLQQLQP